MGPTGDKVCRQSPMAPLGSRVLVGFSWQHLGCCGSWRGAGAPQTTPGAVGQGGVSACAALTWGAGSAAGGELGTPRRVMGPQVLHLWVARLALPNQVGKGVPRGAMRRGGAWLPRSASRGNRVPRCIWGDSPAPAMPSEVWCCHGSSVGEQAASQRRLVINWQEQRVSAAVRINRGRDFHRARIRSQRSLS